MIRRTGFKWRKWAIILVISIVGAPVSAALVLVRTRWGRERMRDLAISALHDELGLRATMGDVRVGLFPLSVSTRHITLDDPVYGRFAEARGLSIRPSLGALLRGRVDLRSIELDEPTIHLVVREGEVRNLPRARGGGGGGDLPFRDLTVKGATLSVDASPLGSANLSDVDLTLHVTDGHILDVRIRHAHGRVTHVRGTEIVQRLAIDAHVDPDHGIDVRSASLRTPYLHADLRDAHVPLPLGADGCTTSLADGSADDACMGGHVELRVALRHLADLPLAWDLPDLRGHVRTSMDLTAHRGGGAVGHGEVHLTDVGVEQFGLGHRIDLELGVTPDRIRIGHGAVHLAQKGGVVGLAGSVGLRGNMPLDLTLGLHHLEFAKLIAQLGVTPNAIVSWMIDGTIGLHGTLAPLDFSGPLHLRTRDFLVTKGPWHALPHDPILGVPRARLSARVAVRSDGLHFDHIVADTAHSRLRGDVLIGFHDALRVAVRTDRIDVADAGPLAGFPIAGQGSAKVDVNGTFSNAVLTSHFALHDFRFNTFPLGDISSDAHLEKDGLAVRFPEVVATKRQSRYHVDNLLLDFTGGRVEATGTVHAQRMALADFFHIFHFENDDRFAPYQGVATGTAKIHYTHGFPDDDPGGTLVADMDLGLPTLNVHGFAFTDGHFAGRWKWLHRSQGYRGGQLTVDDLTLHKGDGTLAVSGTMALGGKLQMSVAADQIGVQDTEGLADRMPSLGGVYSVTGSVSGSANLPRADLDVSLTGLSWGASMLGDGRLYVRLTDRDDPWVKAAAAWDPNALPDTPCAHAREGFAHGSWPADPPVHTVDGPEPALDQPMAFLVCGQVLGGHVKVDLAMGRTEVHPLRGVVDLDHMALGPLLPRNARKDGLGGTVSGRVTFRDGAMLAPETLAGRVLLTELHVEQHQVELQNRGPIDVRLDHGSFRVVHAAFEGPSSALRITGGGGVQDGLALQIDGQVDLGLLATLTPRLSEAQGSFAMRVHVNGPFADPAVFGEATVSDAGFRFAGFPEPLSELGGRITFSARRVLLEGFHARFAGGDLTLHGAAALRDRGINHYDLTVDAHNLAMQPDQGIELGLGGHAQLAWARGDRLPTLRGTVRIDRLLYSKPIQVETLTELSRHHRAEVEQYDPSEDQVAFDLRVENEQPLRIANNVIDAEVRIEDSERPFRLVGTDQRFGVLGTLQITRGTVRFRKAEFDVRHGVIDFDDAFRIDPQFDVRAVTDVRRSGDLAGQNWRITLHAHGNRDNFQLDMSSEPQLSQEDLVLLLTVGMTRAEAEQMQAGDLTSTAALEALAAATGVDREVRRAVPVIDDFSISSAYSVRSGRTEPQVSIGKRIADRVRLTASTNLLGEQREVRAGLELRLSDQTSVQLVYDNQNTTSAVPFGNAGTDFHWRLEFE